MIESSLAKLKRLQKNYNRGEQVFAQGDNTHELYVFLEGEIGVYVDSQKVATVNTPGTYLGEIGALLKKPRSATCICTHSSSLLCIPEDAIELFIKTAPSMGYKLALVLAERLSNMNERFTKLSEEHRDALKDKKADKPAEKPPA